MQKRTLAFILLIAMLAVVAAGCGSGKPAQSEKPAAKSEPIIIAYTPFTGYGALFIAQEKGIFKSKGLDVQLQAIEGVGDRKQALVANKIQAMAASLDVAVSAAGEGVPLKVVWAFDSSAGADGLLARADKGIKSMADLKGKQVAYHTGSTSHFFLSTLLEKAGLKDKDIQSVDMKASEAAAAFMAGKVDAAITWEPHLSKAKAAGATILASSKDAPGLIADVLLIGDELVKKQPDKAKAIVAAMAEATDFMAKNPDETNKILGTVFKQKPEEVAADIKTLHFYDLKGNQEFFGTTEKPGPIYEVANKAGQFYVNLKVLSKAPDVSKFIDGSLLGK